MNNKKRYHWSDCSLHNMPAMPNKPCNCGGDAPPPKSKSNKLKEGDKCNLKGNDYMKLRIKKILPKGSHGRKCVLVECLASSGTYPDENTKFALIKTFRMIDLIAVK